MKTAFLASLLMTAAAYAGECPAFLSAMPALYATEGSLPVRVRTAYAQLIEKMQLSGEFGTEDIRALILSPFNIKNKSTGIRLNFANALVTLEKAAKSGGMTSDELDLMAKDVLDGTSKKTDEAGKKRDDARKKAAFTFDPKPAHILKFDKEFDEPEAYFDRGELKAVCKKTVKKRPMHIKLQTMAVVKVEPEGKITELAEFDLAESQPFPKFDSNPAKQWQLIFTHNAGDQAVNAFDVSGKVENLVPVVPNETITGSIPKALRTSNPSRKLILWNSVNVTFNATLFDESTGEVITRDAKAKGTPGFFNSIANEHLMASSSAGRLLVQDNGTLSIYEEDADFVSGKSKIWKPKLLKNLKTKRNSNAIVFASDGKTFFSFEFEEKKDSLKTWLVERDASSLETLAELQIDQLAARGSSNLNPVLAEPGQMILSDDGKNLIVLTGLLHGTMVNLNSKNAFALIHYEVVEAKNGGREFVERDMLQLEAEGKDGWRWGYEMAGLTADRKHLVLKATKSRVSEFRYLKINGFGAPKQE